MVNFENIKIDPDTIQVLAEAVSEPKNKISLQQKDDGEITTKSLLNLILDDRRDVVYATISSILIQSILSTLVKHVDIKDQEAFEEDLKVAIEDRITAQKVQNALVEKVNKKAKIIVPKQGM